jgi:hypothetical protein
MLPTHYETPREFLKRMEAGKFEGKLHEELQKLTKDQLINLAAVLLYRDGQVAGNPDYREHFPKNPRIFRFPERLTFSVPGVTKAGSSSPFSFAHAISAVRLLRPVLRYTSLM